MAVSGNDNESRKKLTLFVKNLPENTTKEQLELLFSEVGKVRRCFVVKKRRTDDFKGIGFVTFANSEDVDAALKRTLKLGSNQLNVTLAEDKKKHDPFALQQNTVKISFTKDAKHARKQQKSRLIVRNLSFKATEEDLKKSFGIFGDVLRVNIPKKPDGKMRGFAFVQYKRVPDAMEAVKQLNMKDIKGRTVAVDFTVAKIKFEKARKDKNDEPKEGKRMGKPDKSNSNEKDSSDEEGESERSEDSSEEEKEKTQTLNGKRKKQPQKKVEESGSDSSDGTDEEESSDNYQLEKEHLQKRLKKSKESSALTQQRKASDESDSEVEFGSDGEVRLVPRDQVKDKKKVLKKKLATLKHNDHDNDDDDEGDGSGGDAKNSEDEDDGAMDVDGNQDTDEEDDDDEEGDEGQMSTDGDEQPSKSTKKGREQSSKTEKTKNKKNEKQSKKTANDSDSDWGHTPSEGSGDETESENNDDEAAKRRAEMIKNEDLSRTVFISNISFETTQNTLQEHLKKYGPYKFCLLCMDKVLNRSKGTAFVKFVEKTDADKCTASIQAGELTLDGKVLSASSAMKRDKLQEEIVKKANSKKQPKDNRNLYLAREGFIRAGTNVAADMSDHDLKLRAKLEANKKKALKNLHNFVSPNRLCIHNLPPTCDSKQLREIFAASVDRSARITEARVMLNMKRLGPDGKGISKGFGFVTFEKHEDALKALRYVNNNPETFTDQMRPVVSFSIENKAALMVKERRLQRSREKLQELQQMKTAAPSQTAQRSVDYEKGERLSFEGLRAKTDMKTLPRRVGEKVRLDPRRRNHQMKLKRLAKKSKKQPEFKKKKEKKIRGPTKAQLKEKRQDRQLNDIIDKRRKNLNRKSE